VRIRADHITSVALVLHELATNAAKYGSLSSEEGRLVVACTTGETMQIMWSERGGPVVRAPTSKGFGSTLIQRTITGMRGEICYTWSPDGLDITICLPINTISASPDRTSLS
jgi:two-component sensor histidine kinase